MGPTLHGVIIIVFDTQHMFFSCSGWAKKCFSIEWRDAKGDWVTVTRNLSQKNWTISQASVSSTGVPPKPWVLSVLETAYFCLIWGYLWKSCSFVLPLGLEGFAYVVPCRQKGVCSWCGTFEFRQCISGFDSWWRGAWFDSGVHPFGFGRWQTASGRVEGPLKKKMKMRRNHRFLAAVVEIEVPMPRDMMGKRGQ